MRAAYIYLLALFGIAMVVVSQTSDKGVKTLEPSPDSASGKEQRVALVVGIDHYDPHSGFPALKWAQNDASAMADSLGKLGYVVQRIPEDKATAAEILRAIAEQGKLLTPVRGNSKQGTFLFYFSGHGTSAGSSNYLVTVNTSRERLSREALGMDEVQRKLAESPARRKILLIDACRTVPKVDNTRGPVEDSEKFAEFNAAEGERILLAAPFGDPSREFDELKHGAFTYFLLQALASKAFITFRELADSVSRQTKSWTHDQGVTQVPKELGEATFDFAVGGELGNPVAAGVVPASSARAPNSAGEAVVRRNDKRSDSSAAARGRGVAEGTPPAKGRPAPPPVVVERFSGYVIPNTARRVKITLSGFPGAVDEQSAAYYLRQRLGAAAHTSDEFAPDLILRLEAAEQLDVPLRNCGNAVVITIAYHFEDLQGSRLVSEPSGSGRGSQCVDASLGQAEKGAADNALAEIRSGILAR